MNMEHIAQAILIADDLLAQYGDVVARMGQLDGPETLADDFSTLIGEANRVYTGVWEHLDEAAAELAAAGRHVQHYAQMRAEHGQLGILDSTSHTGLALGASVLTGSVTTQTSVAAKANAVGAAHAADVSAAFKSKLPEYDWNAARRAADAPPEDISSNGATYFGIAVALGVVAFIAYVVMS